jgi:hypothetical protein
MDTVLRPPSPFTQQETLVHFSTIPLRTARCLARKRTRVHHTQLLLGLNSFSWSNRNTPLVKRRMKTNAVRNEQPSHTTTPRNGLQPARRIRMQGNLRGDSGRAHMARKEHGFVQ